MADEPEALLERVLKEARVEVAPRVTVDPAGPAPAFLDDVLARMRDALRLRLQTQPGVFLPSAFGVLILVSPVPGDPLYGHLVQVVTDTQLRLAGLSPADQRQILVDQIVTAFNTRDPESLRQVVEEVRKAQAARLAAPGGALPRARAGLTALPPSAPDINPLVDALALAARNYGIRFFRGFLGQSELPGYRRLYSDLQFNDYLDIPVESIEETADLRTPSNPLGGSVVWVRVGAKMIRGRTAMARVELQGQFLSTAPDGGWANRGEGWTSLGRSEGWTSVAGEGWTSLGRSEGWTSVAGEGWTSLG